ncbi:tight junction protein ZO-1-like isoform X5 [Branchiostoma floridae]|uniref:Tight junction protein ZO-1-like isoform X5 n=1 Tax=Branchiostoma floridae TaxID=7739 RepID=A0A9J7KWK4_BRAFL|nr:tight junction protein ZO-1-like isoform X5 [Branchiostoma floridae]
MAGRSTTHARLLAKHRAAIVQDLDVAKIIPSLVYTGVFSLVEEGEILSERTRQLQTEVFVDLLSRKGPAAFQEFCSALEDSFPHLLTCFLLDNPDVTSEAEEEKSPSKALQLGFELALKERDAVLRENALALKERDTAMKQYQEMKHERDQALASLESLTTKQGQGLTQRFGGSQGLQGSPVERQTRTRRERRRGKDETEAREQVVWEQLSFTINRAPGYGFGIAVSGGRDNPHFTSGETSIVISDVLPGGPAEGLLKVNDRVVSVNRASLDHVDHSQAVNILKDSRDSAVIVVKRRNVVTVPGTPDDRLQTKKVTLTRTKKKEDYGMKLGYHLYVKEVTEKGLAAQSGQLGEGDLLLKINNSSVENLSFSEAKKLVEKSKDKLVLTVQSEGDSPPASPLQGSQLSLPRDRGPYDTSPDRAATLPLGAKSPLQSDPMDPPQSPFSDDKYRRTSPYADEAPPRPPLPRLDTPLTDSGHYGEPSSRDSRDKLHDAVYGKKWRQPFYSEPRLVKFHKQGAVGIRLAGGNEVGIYVAAVQEDSAAYQQGLQPGDQLLSVNEIDMRAMTREEAVLLLLSLQDEIRIVAQDRKDKYDKILEMGSGDSFYVRTHFNYEKQGKEELSFKKGDIFHIRDTLHQGVVGSWLAVRIGKNNLETERGVIPNKNRGDGLLILQHRAEQLAHVQNTDAKESQSGKRSGFFRRRSYRRSKSLNKEHWDDIVFGRKSNAGPTTKFPAYERVVLKEPGFPRPVVIFGPIADVTRDRLLREMPDKLDSAQSIKKDKEAKGGASTIIKLNAIRDVVEKGKHCVLDITPNAVDRLNYAQLYPIVIFLQPDNKQTVKDLRSRIAKGSNKSSRKLFEQAMKLKQGYSHLFTAVVHLSNNDAWYSKVKDIIRKQQSQPVWMSENKMEDNVEDDFLFPMSARFSYASSSEGNLATAVDSRPVSMFNTSDTWGETGPESGRMGRSTSDPSLTVDGQPPHTGSPYAPHPTRQLSSDRPGNYSQFPPEKAPRSRDNSWSVRPPVENNRHSSHGPYYNAYGHPQGDNMSGHNSFPRENNRHPRSFSSIEPYATLPPDNDRYRDYSQHNDTWGTRKKEPSYQTGYGNYDNYPRKDEGGYPSEQRHRPNGYSSRDTGEGGGKTQPPPYDRHVHRASQVLSASREYLAPQDHNQSPKSAFGQPSSYDRRTLPSRERSGGYDPYKFTRMTAHSLSRGSKTSLTGSNTQSTNSIQRPTPTYPKMPLSNGPMTDPRRGQYSPLSKTKSEPHISHSPPVDSAIESSDVVQSSVYPTKTIPVIERLDTGEDSMVSDTGSNQSENRRDNGADSARLQMTPERERDVYNRSYRDGLKPAVYSAMEFRRRTLDDLRIPKTQLDHVPTSDSVVMSSSGDQKVDHASELEPDENHTVIATARGMFDSNGGVLSNAETGVSIIIPKGAIPEGTKQEIYFKVCRDNNILPPLDKDKGETLLSPLVMCGPHGLKFLQPVELRLPHCASMTPDGWSFALKSSDTSTGQPTQWQNMTLPGMNNNSQCQVGASSVSVLVDHFSWFALIGWPRFHRYDHTGSMGGVITTNIN